MSVEGGGQAIRRRRSAGDVETRARRRKHRRNQGVRGAERQDVMACARHKEDAGKIWTQRREPGETSSWLAGRAYVREHKAKSDREMVTRQGQR